jgi:hypothetical protein
MGFDTNNDGVLDAQDELFHQFGVWQDANGNGIADEGEVLSLTEWGIMSVMLSSDGVMRYLEQGVTEFGRGSVVMQDGSTMLLADAAFSFTTLPQLPITDAATIADYAFDEGNDELLPHSEDLLTIDMVLPVFDVSSPLAMFAEDNMASVMLATNHMLIDTLLLEETMQY